LLGHTPFWNLQLTNQESIVKTALTLVGGVGAVAYLVIKYGYSLFVVGGGVRR